LLAPGRKLQTLPLKGNIKLIDTVEKCPARKKKKKLPRISIDIVPNTLSTIFLTNNQILQLEIISGQLSSSLHKCLKFVAFQREPFSTLLDK
jgi:hypothetical protein